MDLRRDGSPDVLTGHLQVGSFTRRTPFISRPGDEGKARRSYIVIDAAPDDATGVLEPL